jgi:hypothetical protein
VAPRKAADAIASEGIRSLRKLEMDMGFSWSVDDFACIYMY